MRARKNEFGFTENEKGTRMSHFPSSLLGRPIHFGVLQYFGCFFHQTQQQSLCSSLKILGGPGLEEPVEPIDNVKTTKTKSSNSRSLR
jgi:hypothetical protein